MQTETTEKRCKRSAGSTPLPLEGTSRDGSYIKPEEDRLESWKEIAAFINRDERTAMRWAKELGMPVRRIPGSKRSRIFASREEISKWRLGRSEPASVAVAAFPKALSRKRLVAGIAGLCLVAALLAVGIATRHALRPRPLAARVSFTGSAIQALDAEGNRLWTYDFGPNFDRSALDSSRRLEDFVRIADLRGDGQWEVLMVAPFRIGKNPNDPPEFEVDCFSQTGRRLWTHVPQERFRFGNYELQGPWYPQDILISNGPMHEIWMAFSHYMWGNSYVANLDAITGRSVLRYVNTGDVRSLNELSTPRAKYLLVGGFNNEHDSGNLAVMDELKPFAASPQTPGTRHKCVSCPEGSPDYYFVFPRSELNRFRKAYENAAWGIQVEGDQFTVSTRDLGPQKADVQTWFRFRSSRTIRPISVRYGSGYDMLHRELEKAHLLGHSLETCPERLDPAPIRMWTPATGWTEIHLPPRSFDQ